MSGSNYFKKLKKYEDQDINSCNISKDEIINLKMKMTHTRCQRCENHCSLNINKFDQKYLYP